jgi:hypothetical protein
MAELGSEESRKYIKKEYPYQDKTHAYNKSPPKGGSTYVGGDKESSAGAGRGGKDGVDKGDLDSPAKDLFKGLGGIKKAP